MAKWKLMMSTIPYVFMMVAVKVFLFKFFAFEGMLDFSDIGVVVTGGVFLIGFMLAGVIADYKESEKIPGEIAATLESLEETYSLAAASRPALDARGMMESLQETSDILLTWFYHQTKPEDTYAALERISKRGAEIDAAGATAIANRLISEVAALRKIIIRVHVIADTSYVATGYALLESLTVLVMGLLLIAKFKSLLGAIVLVAFVTLIFVYMLRLIHDLDNPFEYSNPVDTDEPMAPGCTEVDLAPIREYRDRLEAKLAPPAAKKS